MSKKRKKYLGSVTYFISVLRMAGCFGDRSGTSQTGDSIDLGNPLNSFCFTSKDQWNQMFFV